MNRKILYAPLLAASLLALSPSIGKAQTYVELYGQNRIQERKFDWKFFDTKHFRVYHYDKAGRQLGRYVAEEAENDISLIEKKLGGQFPARFSIILYNSFDEYRQTNVGGLKDDVKITVNTSAGNVDLVGDKLVVYFTGKHSDLRHQIRTGMAKVVMQRMIFGADFKKMVKNALLLNLPEWVTDGYIAYLVDGWDPKSSSEWKGLLDARPKTGFYELAEEYPELAGKAFWKFVSSQYGTPTVKNLLYSMQLKTSLNKAMKAPDGLNLKVTKAYDSCIKFYKKTYALDARKQQAPDSTHGLIALKVPKDNTIVRNILVSPRGSDVAYVAWKEGKYTVYTQKTADEQAVSTLLEGGQKDLTELTDPNYPLMAWSNSGYKLAILYKKGPDTYLKIYNSLKGRIDHIKIPRNRFDRVLGMSFMQDDDKLVFSAIKKSQTDLYTFTFKGSKMTAVTDDIWDDLSPVYVSGGSRTGILFLSNRPAPYLDVPLGVNELPAGPMNVFFYNTRTGAKELLQCSTSPKGEITQPIQYGPDNFAYLSDSNGINNKYVVLFARDKKNKDSAFAVPVTNYRTSILSHQYNVATGDVADVVQDKDKYRVYFHELKIPSTDTPPIKLSPTLLSIEKPEPKNLPDNTAVTAAQTLGTIEDQEPDEEGPRLKSGNAFQSEFDAAEEPHQRRRKIRARAEAARDKNIVDSSILSVLTDSAYVKMKPSTYRHSFKPDNFSMKLNNCVLFSQYQSIATNGGQYTNPNLGALTTISFNELLENQRITAGFQMPINVSGSSYFLQYQNFTRKLDWGLLYLRGQDREIFLVPYTDQQGKVQFYKEQLFKTVLNMVQADISYPFDRVRSLRFHTAMRQDLLVQKATDSLSLSIRIPGLDRYTSLSRLEYVFDNTRTPALNIQLGTKYKVYTEYLQQLNNENKGCYNIGFDFRNYQKLYKNMIIANRVAYAHSDGSSQVEYLAGGVDNWISPQKAANGNQQRDAKFGFQTLGTPIRGYKQYARTGNNFFVFNTEVRLPLATTFMKRPIQSPSLKNLQLVVFADAGSAWNGFLPDANSSNTTYTFPTAGPSTGLNNVFLNITIPNSGGLAMGYGAGLRTSIFGYFVRLDAAWNIDGIKKPIWYLALGTDF